MRLIDADGLEPIEVGIDEMSFLAVDYDDIKNAPTIEPNLVINPDEIERGDVVEIGENIVVMHHDDYYDMFLKSAAVDDGSWERFAAEPCEDAISREDAIKNIECWKDKVESEQDEYFNLGLWQAIREIRRAPSVAPKHSGEATEMVEDAISREWIKDYCKKQIDHYEMRKKRILSEKAISYNPKEQIEGFEDEITIYKWILREVDKLPSVAPSRPSGEWIYCEDENGIDGYRCSNCGKHIAWDYQHKFINFIEDYHTCPFCDARMKGADDAD